MSSDSEKDDKADKAQRQWNRGKHVTPALRATQFPGVMEVRRAAMWCTFCQVPVGFKEKCTAAPPDRRHPSWLWYSYEKEVHRRFFPKALGLFSFR